MFAPTSQTWSPARTERTSACWTWISCVPVSTAYACAPHGAKRPRVDPQAHGQAAEDRQLAAARERRQRREQPALRPARHPLVRHEAHEQPDEARAGEARGRREAAGCVLMCRDGPEHASPRRPRRAVGRAARARRRRRARRADSSGRDSAFPELCPVAGGGPGTLEVLLPALGGETAGARVRDAVGARGRRRLRARRRRRDGDRRGGAGRRRRRRVVGAVGGLVAAAIARARRSSSSLRRIGRRRRRGRRRRGDRARRRAARGGARGAVRRASRCGLARGLAERLGAQLVPGAAFVLEELGFDARMRAARAVVVGEALLDRGTLGGRVAGEIAIRARQAGIPATPSWPQRDRSLRRAHPRRAGDPRGDDDRRARGRRRAARAVPLTPRRPTRPARARSASTSSGGSWTSNSTPIMPTRIASQSSESSLVRYSLRSSPSGVMLSRSQGQRSMSSAAGACSVMRAL